MARCRPHGRSKSDHRVCQAARHARAAEYRERISISAEQQEARIAAVNAECNVEDAPRRRRGQKWRESKVKAGAARVSGGGRFCKASCRAKKGAKKCLEESLGKAAERDPHTLHCHACAATAQFGLRGGKEGGEVKFFCRGHNPTTGCFRVDRDRGDWAEDREMRRVRAEERRLEEELRNLGGASFTAKPTCASERSQSAGSWASMPMSRSLLATLLLIGGIERNPGPATDKGNAALQGRTSSGCDAAQGSIVRSGRPPYLLPSLEVLNPTRLVTSRNWRVSHEGRGLNSLAGLPEHGDEGGQTRQLHLRLRGGADDDPMDQEIEMKVSIWRTSDVNARPTAEEDGTSKVIKVLPASAPEEAQRRRLLEQFGKEETIFLYDGTLRAGGAPLFTEVKWTEALEGSRVFERLEERRQIKVYSGAGPSTSGNVGKGQLQGNPLSTETTVERFRRLAGGPRVQDEVIVNTLVTKMAEYKKTWSDAAVVSAPSPPGTLFRFAHKWQLVERTEQLKELLSRWREYYEEQADRLPDSASYSERQYQDRRSMVTLVLGPPGSGKTTFVEKLPELITAVAEEEIPNDRTGSFRRILRESMSGPPKGRLQYYMDVSSRDFTIRELSPFFEHLASKPERWLGLLSLLMYMDTHKKKVGLVDVLNMLPDNVIVWLEAHHVWLAMHKLHGLEASFIHLVVDEASVLRGEAKYATRLALSRFSDQIGKLAREVSAAITLCSTRLMGGPAEKPSPSRGVDHADDAATRKTESDLIDRATFSGKQEVGRVFLTPISQEAAQMLLRVTCEAAGFRAPRRLSQAVILMLEYASARPRLLEMAIAAMSRAESHDVLQVDDFREFVTNCTYGRLTDALLFLRQFIQRQEYFKHGESRFGEGRTRLLVYRGIILSSLRGCKHSAVAPIIPDSTVTWGDVVESGHIENASNDVDYVIPRVPPCILETFLVNPAGAVLRPLVNLFGRESAWFTGDDKENTDLVSITFQGKLLHLTGKKAASLCDILNLSSDEFPTDHQMQWPLLLEGLNYEEQKLQKPWTETQYEAKCAAVSAYYGGGSGGDSNGGVKSADQSSTLSKVAGNVQAGTREFKQAARRGSVPDALKCTKRKDGGAGLGKGLGKGAPKVVGLSNRTTARLTVGETEAPSRNARGLRVQEAGAGPRQMSEEQNEAPSILKSAQEKVAAAGRSEVAATTISRKQNDATEGLPEDPQAMEIEGLPTSPKRTVKNLLDDFEVAQLETQLLQKEGASGEGILRAAAVPAQDDIQKVPFDKLGPAEGKELVPEEGGCRIEGPSEPANEFPLLSADGKATLGQPEDRDETSESGPSKKRGPSTAGEKGCKKKRRRLKAATGSKKMSSSVKNSLPAPSSTGVESGQFPEGGGASGNEEVATSPTAKARGPRKKEGQRAVQKSAAQGSSASGFQGRAPTLFYQGAPQAERPDTFGFLPRALTVGPQTFPIQQGSVPPKQAVRGKMPAKSSLSLLDVLRVQLQSKSTTAPNRDPLSDNAFELLVRAEAAKMYCPEHPCSLMLLCMDRPQPKMMMPGLPNVVVLDKSRWSKLYLELGNFKRVAFDLLEALRSEDPPPANDCVAGYCCPDVTCRKRAYILRSWFVKHMVSKHQISEEEALKLAQAAEEGFEAEA